MVIYLDDFKGKGKESGKDFHKVSLLQVRKNSENGKLFCRVVDFFVNDVDCSRLSCGDVVQAEFEESVRLGGKPTLVGLQSMGKNVFVE